MKVVTELLLYFVLSFHFNLLEVLQNLKIINLKNIKLKKFWNRINLTKINNANIYIGNNAYSIIKKSATELCKCILKKTKATI